jgi:hypothetical protein
MSRLERERRGVPAKPVEKWPTSDVQRNLDIKVCQVKFILPEKQRAGIGTRRGHVPCSSKPKSGRAEWCNDDHHMEVSTVAGVVATGAGLVVVGSRPASSASMAVQARPSRLQMTKNLCDLFLSCCGRCGCGGSTTSGGCESGGAWGRRAESSSSVLSSLP